MLQQIISAILALVMGLGSFLGIQTGQVQPKDCNPVVFVHGLGGWGQGALFDYLIPHWGMMAGSMRKKLNSQGYETYAASMGPVSSAWDRACELYAQLTGTRVDYGAAHAKEHNHDRYGETYQKALMEQWTKERAIILIGHSFGGATIRLFAQLCEEGSKAERDAKQDKLSPLFAGKEKGKIKAIVTLAAPHNGTTALEPAIAEDTSMASDLTGQMMGLAKIGMVLPIVEAFYPFRLGQFGLNTQNFYRKPISTWKAADEVIERKDNAKWDLSIDGALALNKDIKCQPGIYYFSYAAVATKEDAKGNHVPKDLVWDMFKESSAAMGKKRASYKTAGGMVIDDAWLPNDGLVNTISALFPFNEPYKIYDAKKIEKGKWQVMPLVTGFDHVDFGGGMQKLGGVDGIHEFYAELMKMLEKI